MRSPRFCCTRINALVRIPVEKENIDKSFVNDHMIVFYAYTPKALVEKPDSVFHLLSQPNRSS